MGKCLLLVAPMATFLLNCGSPGAPRAAAPPAENPPATEPAVSPLSPGTYLGEVESTQTQTAQGEPDTLMSTHTITATIDENGMPLGSSTSGGPVSVTKILTSAQVTEDSVIYFFDVTFSVPEQPDLIGNSIDTYKVISDQQIDYVASLFVSGFDAAGVFVTISLEIEGILTR